MSITPCAPAAPVTLGPADTDQLKIRLSAAASDAHTRGRAAGCAEDRAFLLYQGIALGAGSGLGDVVRDGTLGHCDVDRLRRRWDRQAADPGLHPGTRSGYRLALATLEEIAGSAR